MKNIKLKKWFEASVSKIDIKTPMSIHVDELIDNSYEAGSLEKESIILLQELVSILSTNNLIQQIIPILVYPLDYSENLELSYSNWKNHKHDEPPSLYMMDRNNTKIDCIQILYKCPVTDSIFGELPNNYRIYYECRKDRMALENEWEFFRGIYVKYYPKDFIG